MLYIFNVKLYMSICFPNVKPIIKWCNFEYSMARTGCNIDVKENELSPSLQMWLRSLHGQIGRHTSLRLLQWLRARWMTSIGSSKSYAKRVTSRRSRNISANDLLSSASLERLDRTLERHKTIRPVNVRLPRNIHIVPTLTITYTYSELSSTSFTFRIKRIRIKTNWWSIYIGSDVDFVALGGTGRYDTINFSNSTFSTR